jgi:hypothetical protein
MLFEALHDMPRPVEALSSLRAMLVRDGRALVVDEKTAERFSPAVGDAERLMYGFSVLHCLPVGMVGEGAVGTGTVMRSDTMRRYADEAGFARCDVLPVESDFWRFYLLAP